MCQQKSHQRHQEKCNQEINQWHQEKCYQESQSVIKKVISTIKKVIRVMKKSVIKKITSISRKQENEDTFVSLHLEQYLCNIRHKKMSQAVCETEEIKKNRKPLILQILRGYLTSGRRLRKY